MRRSLSPPDHISVLSNQIGELAGISMITPQDLLHWLVVDFAFFSYKTRIFSYLTSDNEDEGEEFPGKLACDNEGYMKRLTDEEDIISQMQDYYSFLASNTISISNVTWTSPYLDASGLGLMVTVAMPVISKVTNK